MSKPHEYNEAGRKLFAALLSYQIGRAGVDSTLKQVPPIIDDFWAETAKELLKALNEAAAKVRNQP